MTDMQAERLAGEAIGLVPQGIDGRDAFLWLNDLQGTIWTPMSNGAQALRLVQELHLHIDQRPGKQISVQDSSFAMLVYGDPKDPNGLQRAIVECAAKIRLARYDVQPELSATSGSEK